MAKWHNGSMAPAPIREYRSADFETLWQIDQQCFARGISYSRRELAYYIRKKRSFTLVGELAGRIAGFAVVDYDSHGQGHVITIDVLPEARRSGLGSRSWDGRKAATCGSNFAGAPLMRIG